MAIKSVTIKDKSYTAARINQLCKSLAHSSDKLNEQITIAVSAAVGHAGLHSNLDPLITLFKGFRLKSGLLNKQGRQIKDYVLTYYRAIAFGDNDALGFKTTTRPIEGATRGEKETLTVGEKTRRMYLTGKKVDGTDKAEKLDMKEDGFTGLPDFADWLADVAKKPAIEAKKSKVTIGGIRKRLTSLVTAFHDLETMTPSERAEFIEHLDRIRSNVEKTKTEANADPDKSGLKTTHPAAKGAKEHTTNEPNGGKRQRKESKHVGGKAA